MWPINHSMEADYNIVDVKTLTPEQAYDKKKEQRSFIVNNKQPVVNSEYYGAAASCIWTNMGRHQEQECRTKK